MARTLLVGAGGFVGRHVREALAGQDVVCLGRREAGPGSVRMDLTRASASDLARELAAIGPDAVINCAGATDGAAEDLEAANVTIVAILIEAIAIASRGVRLVQLGSAAEYGAPTRRHVDSRAGPASPYGMTKLAATNLVLAADAAGAVDGIVLRVFNPVGAGMSEKTLPGRAAMAMRRALSRGESQITLGALASTRDFMNVRDAAEAAVAAASVTAPAQRLIDCGSGKLTLARALVRRLARVAGFEGDILESAAGSPRSSGDTGRTADLGPMRAILNHTLRHSMDDALRALWNDVSARPP